MQMIIVIIRFFILKASTSDKSTQASVQPGTGYTDIDKGSADLRVYWPLPVQLDLDLLAVSAFFFEIGVQFQSAGPGPDLP